MVWSAVSKYNVFHFALCVIQTMTNVPEFSFKSVIMPEQILIDYCDWPNNMHIWTECVFMYILFRSCVLANC